ncbi:hypothetical protein Pelo_10640 [Pelomyxa schiedti]|nr:hypothetical protein Pelo_10640 [Pelomyxa schiedti]
MSGGVFQGVVVEVIVEYLSSDVGYLASVCLVNKEFYRCAISKLRILKEKFFALEFVPCELSIKTAKALPKEWATAKVLPLPLSSSGMGMTSLMYRLARDEFMEHNLGAAFLFRDVPVLDGSVKLEFWFPSKYERSFHYPMIRFRCSVCLLCFDMSSRHGGGYEELEGWVEQAKPYMKNAKIVVCGLKYDLIQHIKAEPSKSSKHVPVSEARKQAQKIGADAFVPISALTGHNIPQLRSLVAKMALYTRMQQEPHPAGPYVPTGPKPAKEQGCTLA